MKGFVSFCLTLALTTAIAHGAEPPHSNVFYQSGNLKIEAYLFKPSGDGPFPVIVYNHGSREGHERQEVTFAYIAEVFVPAGYAVLVPERRGYGRSDGTPFSEAVRNDVGPRFVARMQDETGDVLAAVDYLETLSFINPHRIAIAGWSLGGIVTIFAVSRSDAFAAAIDQAGGALTWNHSSALRSAMIEAVAHAHPPILLMVAENDRTTESITTLDRVLTEHGLPHEAKIYPPFHPASHGSTPDGHRIFSRAGVSVWSGDALNYVDRYLN